MAKPSLNFERISRLLKHEGVDLKKEKFLIGGVRGYYLNTKGRPGKNDRGIWDDVIYMVTEDGQFVVFCANVDPSRVRKGRGFKEGSKGMASLKAMFHKDLWMIGRHKSIKTALRQASPCTVVRDGIDEDYEDTGSHFMINGHPGSTKGTSSAGCQTFMPSDWPTAIAFAVRQMNRYGKKRVSYLLSDNKDGSIA